MRRIIRKAMARSQGETLTETLVAILICSLAIVLLVTTTSAAVRLNAAAQSYDQRVTTQQTYAETYSSDITPQPTGTVSIAGQNYKVSLYGGEYATSYTIDKDS